MDVSGIVLGVVLAFTIGGIALLVLMYAPPGSERVANALIDAAIKLLDAAIKAINKSIQKQTTVIGADTFDPVPEQRLSDLVALRNGLEDRKE